MNDTRTEADSSSVARYADPRLLATHFELSQYAVGIMPVVEVAGGHDVNPLEQGSGTCVVIGGRYFVATAHVVLNYPKQYYAILSPELLEGAPKIERGGMRGGRRRGDLDIAWLELSARAAAILRRGFLDLARIAPHHDGTNDTLCVYGAPLQDQVRSKRDGTPSVLAAGSMWTTRRPKDKELPDDTDPREIRLIWPRTVRGHDGEPYDYPEAPGMSGGGVWALNTSGHGERWRADQAQLIGVEFAERREHGCRHLVAQRMSHWLEMVAKTLQQPEAQQTLAANVFRRVVVSSPT